MKPKYRVGDKVLNLNGVVGVIDEICWSYAYHLEGEPPNTCYQPEEILHRIVRTPNSHTENMCSYCPNQARPGQRTCAVCHAAYMRSYRKRPKRET